MRTGPVPSLDGKGPIVYNPFRWEDVFTGLTFIFNFAEGCAAGGSAGTTLGAGACFAVGGPVLVAPFATGGAALGCLGLGFGSAFGWIEHQPVI